MTHVLVTRPLDASEQLAEQLLGLGLSPVVMPLYTFVARKPAPDATLALLQESRRRLAVFTSPRAVQFALPWLPVPGQLNGMEIAVVGSATRASLQAPGYPVHFQAQSGFTSEDLLQLPGLARDPGVAVIFCAPGGRQALAEGLHDLGWEAVDALVYERVPLQPEAGQLDDLRNSGQLISIWTSISALTLAEDYLPADVWGKILASPALVISGRIQHHLMQRGASRVELADGPGNPELLKSISRLTGQQISG